MNIFDKRKFILSDINNPVPGTVIFYKNKHLLITEDPEIYVDLSTGDLLESPIGVLDSQILNNVKLVIE